MKSKEKEKIEAILRHLLNPETYPLPNKIKIIKTEKPKMSIAYKRKEELLQEKKPYPHKSLVLDNNLYATALPTLFIGYKDSKLTKVLTTKYFWFVFENKELAKKAEKRVSDFIKNFAIKISKNKRG